MIQVTTDQAKDRLPALIDAASRGETVLIENNAGTDTQVVQLVAVSKRPHRRRKAGTARGLILYMADDFDSPLEDFREYME
jgi:antitoxin (DNA-binding transcriptional repressor) of toxin-antitoxin stability system